MCLGFCSKSLDDDDDAAADSLAAERQDMQDYQEDKVKCKIGCNPDC